MNRIIVVAFIMIVSLINAQTEKGNMLLNANINFSSKSNDNDYYTATQNDIISQSNYSLNPSFGYFLSNNFALGVEFNYDNSKQRQIFGNYDNSIPGGGISIEGLQTSQIFTIGIFANNYFPIIDKFSFFLKSTIGFGMGKIEEQYTSSAPIPDTKISISELSINPGLIYFVNSKLGININFADLHYTNVKYNNKNFNSTISQNDFGLTLSSSTLFVGINYHFK